MVNLWGYRLPLTPTLKSFRSAYRAARRKAILHDASYIDTIELDGSRAAIIETLSKVTAGGPFAGKK
jgi:ribonuclease P/MRP protein subunit POP1